MMHNLRFTCLCFILLFVVTPGVAQNAVSQDTVPLTNAKGSGYCGNGSYRLRTDMERPALDPARQILSLPDVVGIYFHVVKNDDGSGMETSMDSIMLKYQYFVDAYAPHGICFLLVGFDEIHNTDLDTQYYNTEEAELDPYIKPGMLNVFIHNYLAASPGGSTAGGYAYAIPNPYFSWWEESVADSNSISVIAHEIGHCLGLFHTHEDLGGSSEERVDRSGPCKNCDTNGDLLCDTEADPDLSLPGLMSGCTYIATIDDACNDLYIPDPANIMSYAPGNCHTLFTTGQGDRMLYHLNWVTFLYDMLLPVNIVFPSNLSFLFDDAEWFWLAEEFIHMESPSLVCSESAEVTFAAGTEITIGPGTTFSPTTGFVSVFVQDICD
jgi:hypothetical protein